MFKSSLVYHLFKGISLFRVLPLSDLLYNLGLQLLYLGEMERNSEKSALKGSLISCLKDSLNVACLWKDL